MLKNDWEIMTEMWEASDMMLSNDDDEREMEREKGAMRARSWY